MTAPAGFRLPVHVPACWFGVDCSPITRAIGEVRPLLAVRGCTIAAGVRLRALAEVIHSLGVSGQTGIIRLLFCSPAQPASCADIAQARKSGLVKYLTDGRVLEILADTGYQGPGAQSGGRVVTPPHRKFKKNPTDWYEEI